MIPLKSQKEIDLMRRCNQVIVATWEKLVPMIEPGVTTLELDQVAEASIRKHAAKPAFKGYKGFPATLCTSVNEVVVHGIPGPRKLKAGDMIGIDMGTQIDGYFGDSAQTFPVGAVSREAERLLSVSRAALYRGISAMQPGGHLHDVGAAIAEHAEAEGYSVVREFVGHGIGQELHEEPQVPNFGRRGSGITLRPGMVLAIEPMINQGVSEVRVLKDGWTAVTADGKLSAHFEHSVAITENGPDILSVRPGEDVRIAA